METIAVLEGLNGVHFNGLGAVATDVRTAGAASVAQGGLVRGSVTDFLAARRQQADLKTQASTLTNEQLATATQAMTQNQSQPGVQAALLALRDELRRRGLPVPSRVGGFDLGSPVVIVGGLAALAIGLAVWSRSRPASAPVNGLSGNVRLRLKKVDGEYQVQFLRNGKKVESKTYYTDDRDDAQATMRAMQAQIDRGEGLNGLRRGRRSLRRGR